MMALIFVCAVTAPALASSSGEIRAAADGIAAGKPQSQGIEGQRRAVEQLGQLSLELIDQVDQATLSGREKAQREALRAAFEAVAAPLEAIYGSNAAQLDRMSKEVMDQDGDLEALYDTKEWREGQGTASRALYYLNWLHFYGARLYDGDRRKELLQKAERGFSEFSVGDRQTELLVESLLGRGLVHLELGQTDQAERDLRLVIDSKEASPERRAKARIGLLEAYLRDGKIDKSLEASAQFIAAVDKGSARAEEVPYLRFLRLKALLLASKKGGANAARYRQESLSLVEALRRQGGAWKERAEALLSANVDDPALWAGKAETPFAQWNLARLLVQKGQYKEAQPLLESIVKSDDAEARRHRGEAAYMLGVAEFRSGDYESAASHMQTAVDNKIEEADEARYLRFKALEMLMAKQPTGELAERLQRAANEFVAAAPEHKNAYEAYLRIGELLQGEGKLDDAIAAYAKVNGDPMYELRARFGTLQSRFELLGNDGGGGGKSPATTGQIQQIGSDIAAVEQRAAALRPQGDEAAEVKAMQAKTALMHAVYANLRRASGSSAGATEDAGDAEIVAALQGFEEKYPKEDDLFATVLRLRLEALARLGRFAEAAAQVRAHGQVLASAEQRQQAHTLAAAFLRGAAAKDAAAAGQARETALALYQIANAGGPVEEKDKLVLAQLYQQSGRDGQARDLYQNLLASGGGEAPLALRGLAALAEKGGDYEGALGRWRELNGKARPGDRGWYEAQYQIARLLLASGKKEASCKTLENLKPAMPGLSDADLRRDLDQLYGRACK